MGVSDVLRVPMSTSLVWANVARPRRPLVYLDLNHFILLARVRKGNAPNGYPRLLEAAKSAVRESRALFVLSGEHVQEVSKITDPRHRRDVTEVMEQLTGFHYLLGRPDLAALEIDAGFRAIYGEPPEVIPWPLIGPSIGRAFGMVGGLRIEDANGRDVTAETRRELGAAFDTKLAIANLWFERRAMQGPSDEELRDLEADPDYRPEVAKASQQSRLDYELVLKKHLDQDRSLRRQRLRDIVSAREVSHEWFDAINAALRQRSEAGLPVPAPGEDEPMKRLLASMPHNQVAISIKTRWHREPQHVWTVNDLADIDALSVAFAYCDAVFTDNATRAALANSPELRSIGTYLPRRPTDLTEWLDALPALAEPELLVSGARIDNPTASPVGT